MDSNFLPLWKALDAPIISLDESHVELFSVLALFLLTLVALVAPRSHRQWVRHLVQTLSLLIFFYIVYSCLGVFGMIRNVLHGVTLIGTIFTESFFWMSLPLVVIAFTITTGPYFCGWICPTGFFQEIVAAIREHISLKIRPVQKDRHKVRSSALNLVLLGLFFLGFLGLVFWLGTTKRFYVEDSSLYWGASLILLVYLVLTRAVDDRAIRALRGVSFVIIFVSALLKTAIISPVHFAFADVSDPASALTTLVLVVASLFLSRAWCRYVCPWGYLMGCLHRVSRLRVQATDGCNQCGSCSKTCRVDAIQNGKVEISQCQFCMACVDRCPQGALEVVDVWKKDRTD
jgi:polyferredoxin